MGWPRCSGSALAAGVVGLVMLAPFILHGTLGQMWARVGRPTDYHPVLSATAHNLWWLVSFGQGKLSDLLGPPLIGGLVTYRVIGLGLVGLAYLLALARTWFDRAPRTLYLATAYLFAAFCLLATQIHENHLIPLFPLLLLAVLDGRSKPPGDENHLPQRVAGRDLAGLPAPADSLLRYSWQPLAALYILFAITASLNMALHFPQLLHIIVPQNPDIWGGAELFWPRWLNSLAQVGLFAYWTVRFGRETWAARPIRTTQ